MTRAAQQMGLSQSAASMAMSELESLLGQKLFERHGKSLRLSHFGQLFLKQAAELIDQARQMQWLGTTVPEQVQGSLVIAASSTVGNYLLPSKLLVFKQHYPNVTVDLTIENTEQVLSGLRSWQYDIGFIEGPCSDKDIVSHTWCEDELVVFCRQSHPLTTQQNLKLQDCLSFPWIFREAGSGTLAMVQQALPKGLVLPEPYLCLGSSEAIKHAVMHSDAVAILSRHVINDAVKVKQLVALTVSDWHGDRPLSHVRLQQRREHQLVQYLLDVFNHTSG